MLSSARTSRGSSAACALDGTDDSGVVAARTGPPESRTRHAVDPPGASDHAAAARRLAAIALMPANHRRRARSASARCFCASAAWAARSTRASSDGGAADAASSATNAAHARALCTSSGRSGVMPGIDLPELSGRLVRLAHPRQPQPQQLPALCSRDRTAPTEAPTTAAASSTTDRAGRTARSAPDSVTAARSAPGARRRRAGALDQLRRIVVAVDVAAVPQQVVDRRTGPLAADRCRLRFRTIP
jgi:hypothetical protein